LQGSLLFPTSSERQNEGENQGNSRQQETTVSTKQMCLKLHGVKRREEGRGGWQAERSEGPADKTTNEGQVRNDVGLGGSQTPSNKTTEAGQTKNDVGLGGS
jgi:hypothetical protein